MGKTTFLLGAAAGYVMGSKAGQERYQQITQMTARVSQNPSVRRLTDELGRAMHMGRQRLGDTVTTTVQQAGTKATQRAKSVVGKASSGGVGTKSGVRGDDFEHRYDSDPLSVPPEQKFDEPSMGQDASRLP